MYQYRWTISQHVLVRVEWFKDKPIAGHKVKKLTLTIRQFEMIPVDSGFHKQPKFLGFLVPVMCLQQHNIGRNQRGVLILCFGIRKNRSVKQVRSLQETDMVMLTPEEVIAPFILQHMIPFDVWHVPQLAEHCKAHFHAMAEKRQRTSSCAIDDETNICDEMTAHDIWLQTRRTFTMFAKYADTPAETGPTSPTCIQFFQRINFWLTSKAPQPGQQGHPTTPFPGEAPIMAEPPTDADPQSPSVSISSDEPEGHAAVPIPTPTTPTTSPIPIPEPVSTRSTGINDTTNPSPPEDVPPAIRTDTDETGNLLFIYF